MDIQSALFYLFASVSTLYVVHFGLYLVGANLYDIKQYKREHVRRLRQKSSASLPLPASAHDSNLSPVGRNKEIEGLVSIGIAAHNEEKVIVRSLDSLSRSSYPHIEIIVADDASRDCTRQLVQDYILRHPEINLRVYRMHKNVGKGKALNTILRRYAHGEFVMTLDADSLVRPGTVANAVTYFDDSHVHGVAANVQIIDDSTVLGILQKFEHMLGYRSKKTYSLLNCEFVVGGVASTYRMSTLREVGFYDTDTMTEDIGLSTKIVSLGNRTHRMVYAADVVAMTEGVASFRGLVRQRYRWKYGSLQNLVKHHYLICNPNPRYTAALTMYRMPTVLISEFALLVSPIAWGYALYMTLAQYNLQLILGAYVTITAYMLITIWYDENLQYSARMRLTPYAFTAYFIFYIMDVVQLLAMVRCLYRSPALLRRKDVGSTWVSPKRIGKQVMENS